MSNTLKIAPDLYTKPPKSAVGGARYDYRSIALATTDMVTTQIVALGVLPAGHRLMDYFLESTDIDSATSAALTVGILNTYYGEEEAAAANAAAYSSGGATNTATEPELVSGQNLVTASNVGQAGGRATKTATLDFTKDIGVDSSKDRIVAVQFSTAPGTPVAGTIGLGLLIDQD